MEEGLTPFPIKVSREVGVPTGLKKSSLKDFSNVLGPMDNNFNCSTRPSHSRSLLQNEKERFLIESRVVVRLINNSKRGRLMAPYSSKLTSLRPHEASLVRKELKVFFISQNAPIFGELSKFKNTFETSLARKAFKSEGQRLLFKIILISISGF